MQKRRLPAGHRRALMASLLAVQGSAAAAVVVPGPLINVDFNGDVGGKAPLPTPITFDGNLDRDEATAASVAYEDADPDNFDAWNGWEGPETELTLANQPQMLVDSKGNATDITVKWSGFTFNYCNYNNGSDSGGGFTSGPNGDGFYCGAAEGPAIVTIGGLDPQRTYDIVTLGGGDPVTFTIGTDTRSIAGWHSTDNPSNWEIFSGTAPDGAGNLVITVTSSGGNYGMGGLQIAPAGSAIDTDGDGLPDTYEDAHNLNKADKKDAALDADGDGLTNLQEYQKGTDPKVSDTDLDGLSDGVETGTGIWLSKTNTGTNPLKADSDGDGLPDGDEDFSQPGGTDPNAADTDGDGFSDSLELTEGTDPADPADNPRLKTAGSLINIDFNGTGGAGGSTSPVTFDGILTLDNPTALSVSIEDSQPAEPDYWNGFDTTNQTAQPLLDSLSGDTPYLLSWSGFDTTYTNYLNGRLGNARTNGPNGDGHLLIGAGITRTGSVVISGADPQKAYDVAVIAGGSDPVSFTAGGETKSIGAWNSASNPSNWVLFKGVVPNASGSILITVSTNGTGNFGIGGIQLSPGSSILDTDGDTMPDLYEDANGLNKNNPADALLDADGDGLSNLKEFQIGTNPQLADTDEDGYPDSVETGTGVWAGVNNTGTDPLKADSDGDGLADGSENLSLADGSDPNKIDTDGDGFADPVEVSRATNPKDPAFSPRRTVSTALVNIDFNGDVGGAAPLPTPLTFDGNLEQAGPTMASVAFVDSNSQDNDFWNGWEESESWSVLADQELPLSDSKGIAASATVLWTGFTFNYVNYTNGRDNGRGFTNGPNGDSFNATTTLTPSVTLGGLDPAGVYQVAAIAGGDPVKFTIGEISQSVPIWQSNTNPANWVVFDAVTPDSAGKIVLQVASINGTTNFGIGGLQLVMPDSAVVRKFRILAISRDAGNGEITLTWESQAGSNYTVFWNTDLTSFTTPVSGQANLPGVAGSMTRTFPAPVAGASRLFFKVKSQ